MFAGDKVVTRDFQCVMVMVYARAAQGEAARHLLMEAE